MTPKLTGLKQYMRVISGCLRVGNPRIAQLSAAQGLAGLEESPDGSRGRTCFRTQVTWLLEGWRLLAGCWASGLGSVLSVGRRPPTPCQGSLSHAVMCSVKATQEHNRSQNDDQNLLQLGPGNGVAAGPLHRAGEGRSGFDDRFDPLRCMLALTPLSWSSGCCRVYHTRFAFGLT